MSELPQKPDQTDLPHDESNIPASPGINAARVESLLAGGDIDDSHDLMLWGSNYATVVLVTDSDLSAIAVYKPQRGERPLWDFPDGTLCYREVASYVVSKALGWQLVPPTVLRDGPRGLGSLQFFIEHNPEIHYFALDDQYVPQLQRFALFDYLINNADRKGGHLLLDTHNKLWGIDHGLTFNVYPKLRTVIWEFAGQPIDETLLTPMNDLLDTLMTSSSALRTALAPLTSPAEIEALQRRAQRLLERQRYPQPGAGPNSPWPPV